MRVLPVTFPAWGDAAEEAEEAESGRRQSSRKRKRQSKFDPSVKAERPQWQRRDSAASSNGGEVEGLLSFSSSLH